MRHRSAYNPSGVYTPRTTRTTPAPVEMRSKFPNHCHCGKRIMPGDAIVYYPANKQVDCADCGAAILRDLKGAALANDHD